MAAHEEVDRRGVVDLFGVHAFDEAEVVGDLGGVGHQGADGGTGLAVLFEGFDGGEEASLVGRGGHGGEAFALHVGFGDGLAVEFGELGFVVEEFEMGGGSVLEEVDNALRFRGDLLGGSEDVVL